MQDRKPEPVDQRAVQGISTGVLLGIAAWPLIVMAAKYLWWLLTWAG